MLIHGKTAKITDFGTSEKVLLQKTRSDHRGTKAYLDPKCFNGNSKQDEKSDIFSFGILLWEISSRTQPCSEFNSISDIELYRMNGGRHDVIPGQRSIKTYIQNAGMMSQKKDQQVKDVTRD